MNQISQVDAVNQAFFADFYLQAWWQDSTFYDAGQQSTATTLDPTIEFQNADGSITCSNNAYYAIDGPTGVTGDNWVTSNQRYFGGFNSPQDLANFPFDKQDLVLGIESNLWDNNLIIFEVIDGFNDNMIPTDFNVTEWNPVSGTDFVPFYNITTHFYPNFNQNYSRLEIHVPLARSSNYYVFKIFLGSILLVLMSIAIYSLDVEDNNRIMGSITVFLALISFLFVAGSSIPKVAYETRLDDFMNFSFLVVFFMMITHSVNYLINEGLGSDYEIPEHKGSFAWYMNLSIPRKIDLVLVIIFSIVYTIGVPIILYLN